MAAASTSGSQASIHSRSSWTRSVGAVRMWYSDEPKLRSEPTRSREAKILPTVQQPPPQKGWHSAVNAVVSPA